MVVGIEVKRGFVLGGILANILFLIFLYDFYRRINIEKKYIKGNLIYKMNSICSLRIFL